jgi:hypothetical protein
MYSAAAQMVQPFSSRRIGLRGMTSCMESHFPMLVVANGPTYSDKTIFAYSATRASAAPINEVLNLLLVSCNMDSTC